MKFLVTLFVLSSVQSSAWATNTDLCVDSRNKAEALKTLQTVRLLASQNGFDQLISSSGFETCNPSLFLAGPAPGEFVHSQIAYPNVCGAIFTFSSPAAMQTFTAKVKAANLTYDLSSKVCVIANLAQHH